MTKIATHANPVRRPTPGFMLRASLDDIDGEDTSKAVTAHTSIPPSGAAFHAGDLQACHAEQRRCRILEHDARGFLLILKSVGGPRS
jgi:hypothetical protein